MEPEAGQDLDATNRALRSWQIILLLLVSLVFMPRLLAIGLTNAGSLGLAKANLNLYMDVTGERNVKLLEQSIDRFEKALALDGDQIAARWGLARAAGSLGRLGSDTSADTEQAADAIQPLIAKGTRNTLLYRDALIAFSYSDQPEEVIELYESGLLLEPTRPMSDTVALAYIERGLPSDLVLAQTLRPGDLYVNYELWQEALEAGDAQAVATYRDRLISFRFEAIEPSDERLIDYAARVIPVLLENGLWDKAKTMNVVSFLAWQHHGTASVQQLLERLIERHPTDPDWHFYLAELYHRRGDLAHASAAYTRVLALDPHYAQAYLRLGMVAEASCDPQAARCTEMEEAAGWYEQYNSLAPNDLLGLSKLTQACAMANEAGVADANCLQAAERMIRCIDDANHSTSTEILDKALKAHTDDRQAVARLLGIAAQDVELGPNLVQNGNAEEWTDGTPRWWIWADMATGDPWNKGAFVGGMDDLDTLWGKVIRIEGFWLDAKPELAPGRVGYWQWDEAETNLKNIEIAPGQPYLVSFFYRTNRVSKNDVAIWVSHDESVLFSGYHRLSPTNGDWIRFTLVGWNRSRFPQSIQPMLSVLSPGEVSFDDVNIRRVIPNAGVVYTNAPPLYRSLEMTSSGCP